ncbi:hypothetical protein AYI68_g176 [Smittium mucronatum]|uniref:Monopolin complex subunit Csm1/Pcs1 C-terminal domain-containing protein n=1 Tax=Smittium mucronatum TaxID=133383 RepID=A0A1R0H944_9FUNG|nr:hypothetical protein AYI68_g176 [Smittium mucronatum]
MGKITMPRSRSQRSKSKTAPAKEKKPSISKTNKNIFFLNSKAQHDESVVVEIFTPKNSSKKTSSYIDFSVFENPKSDIQLDRNLSSTTPVQKDLLSPTKPSSKKNSARSKSSSSTITYSNLNSSRSDSNKKKSSSLVNKAQSNTLPLFSSPAKTSFVNILPYPNLSPFKKISPDINSNFSPQNKASDVFESAQHREFISSLNEWLSKTNEIVENSKIVSETKQEYLDTKNKLLDAGLLDATIKSPLKNRNKLQRNESRAWKNRYEKLYNLKMTEPQKMYNKMIKQVEPFLSAADDKIEKQKQHISALSEQVERLTAANFDLTNKQTVSATQNEDQKSREKELEEEVFSLKLQLTKFESTVTLLQKQRRMSSTAVDSSLREKIKMSEMLSGFKVSDVTNDSEGMYYVCNFSGKLGELDFILGIYEGEEQIEYIPNIDDLSEDQINNLKKCLPPYLLEPFMFNSESSNLLFWRICDSFNKPLQ